MSVHGEGFREAHAGIFADVASLAREQARRRHLEDCDADGLDSEAFDTAFNLVTALDWTCDYEECPFPWKHRLNPSIEAIAMDQNCLYIDRNSLKAAVAEYTKRPWIHTEWLDWYVADVSIYAESMAYIREYWGMIMPMSVRLSLTSTRRKQVLVGIWRLVFSAVKWGFWLGVAYFLFSVHIFAATALISLTAVVQYHKFKSRRVGARLIKAMSDTYKVTESKSISWRILWDELRRSREAGVVWDQELYLFVEQKLKSGVRG